ncbi:hypothetical protein I7I53_08864 [Histoplasma capsulatum var. duboisii H88]|uniref:Uncharacterized protein n=1 Tax=Ajellomyces capsulatus (strain H88) TaxID=544711 RepID=A0A8A1L564_AJEC8|nr:hypothetical protein I7I53_08864 [Histoplasma capsulatum var. duboisii H88]
MGNFRHQVVLSQKAGSGGRSKVTQAQAERTFELSLTHSLCLPFKLRSVGLRRLRLLVLPRSEISPSFFSNHATTNRMDALLYHLWSRNI